MARPRSFDEQEVLDRAMQCFWKKGYEGTSITDLEEATGISRISIYNSFKDKEGLFIAVQCKYHKVAYEFISQKLDQPDLDLIIDFFDCCVAPKSGDATPSDLGCMMVNTVLDVHNIGDSVLVNVKSYREMLTNIFLCYLERCKEAGILKPNLDLEKLSAFLLASMWGAMAVTRLYENADETRKHIDVLLDVIKSWRV